MTELLEQAFSIAVQLDAKRQDAIATILLEELEEGARWDEAFENSQAQLVKVAAKVREDVKADRVHDLGMDEL
jgi:hypothetical protein